MRSDDLVGNRQAEGHAVLFRRGEGLGQPLGQEQFGIRDGTTAPAEPNRSLPPIRATGRSGNGLPISRI